MAFLREDTADDLEMIVDSSVYFVATHYRMSIPQVLAMSSAEFEQSFVWAAAAKQIESEKLNEQNNEMKNKTDIASTKRKGDPFPFE